MRAFPIGRWGVIESPRATEERRPIRRVKVDLTKDRDGNETGFLLITEEEAGTFDVWLEQEEDVSAFLEAHAIAWE